MSSKEANSQSTMTITELSQQTGINPVTLRAWERRYGLIKPSRSAKGHRFYSEADLELIQLIQQWLARGVPVGKVKPLLQSAASPESETSSNQWGDNLTSLLQSLETLDLDAIERQLLQLDKEYPFPLLTEHFFMPLARQLFERWQNHYAQDAEKALLMPVLEKVLHFKLDKLPVDKKHNWLVIPATESVPQWKLLVAGILLAGQKKNPVFCEQSLTASQTEYVIKGINPTGVLLVGDSYLSASELDQLLGTSKSLPQQFPKLHWLAFGTAASASSEQLQARSIQLATSAELLLNMANGVQHE